MYKVLPIAVALALSAPALAVEQQFTWSNPTQNEDGTPFNAATEQKEVRLYCDEYNLKQVWPGNPTIGSADFIPAPHNCRATVVNLGGIESNYSNVVYFDLSGLKLPNPPIQFKFQGDSVCSLPETNFTGTPINLGTCNVSGQWLVIHFEMTPTGFPNQHSRIVSKAIGGNNQDHFYMVSMYDGDVLRFRLKTNGNTTTLRGNTVIPINTKTYGRVTYDGSEMCIFVNGNEDVCTPKTGDIDTSTAETWVGGNPPDNFGSYRGLLAVDINP